MNLTDEELIKRVAEEVMGWKWTITSPLGGPDYWSSESSIGDATIDFNPLTNLNHTFMVVERMRELGYWVYIQGPDNLEIEWHCKFNPSKYEDSSINKSIGHAICMSALKAVENG